MTALRKPGLVNGGYLLSLALGPLVAIFAFACLTVASHGRTAFFHEGALTYLGAAYLALPVIALVTLFARAYRLDGFVFSGVTGIAIGLAYGFHRFGAEAAWPQIVFQSILPFLMVTIAIRLIAGRRR